MGGRNKKGRGKSRNRHRNNHDDSVNQGMVPNPPPAHMMNGAPPQGMMPMGGMPMGGGMMGGGMMGGGGQNQQMMAMMAQMQARMNALEEKTRKVPFPEHIMNATGVFIKQKLDALEALSGMEMANVYEVFPSTKGQAKAKKRKKPIMICKEKKKFCQSRGKIDLKCYDEADEVEDVILEMQKPFQFFVTCCSRPVLLVNLVKDEQRTYIGKVVDTMTAVTTPSPCSTRMTPLSTPLWATAASWGPGVASTSAMPARRLSSTSLRGIRR